MAILISVLAALLARGREPRLGESDERTDGAKTAPAKLALRDGLHVFRYPAYVLHSLALVFFYTAMSVQIWIPAFLHRGFGLTNQQASGFLAQALLYTLPAGIVGGWLSSLTLRRFRWGFPLFLSLTSIAAAAAFYLAYTAPDLRSAQIGIVAAIALFGFSAGTLTTLVVETVPAELRNSAAAFSVVLTSGIAGIVGPELVGVLSDAYTLSKGVLIAPAGYFIAGLIWAVLAAWQARANTTAH